MSEPKPEQITCPHCGARFDAPVRSTAADAIERYYRSRAAGARRVTLRTIAAETGYSYDYLRKAKRAYDASGKWGSKKTAKEDAQV